MLAVCTQHVPSLVAGALIAAAVLHLLPEAFERQASAHELFSMLLAALVFFFLLDKAVLRPHGHAHHQEPGHGPGEHQGHTHHSPAEPHRTQAGGITTLFAVRAQAAGPCWRVTTCRRLATAA